MARDVNMMGTFLRSGENLDAIVIRSKPYSHLREEALTEEGGRKPLAATTDRNSRLTGRFWLDEVPRRHDHDEALTLVCFC